MQIRTLFVVGLLLVVANLAPQERETSYETEVFGSFSTGENTPFWMVNQNWGFVPLDADNGYLRGAVFHKERIDTDVSLRAGLDLAAANNHTYGKVWVQQAYATLDWRKLQLDLGAKQDYTSLLDSKLSSGDFTSSNNARPIPKVRGSLNQFVLVPFTKGRLGVKVDFSIGKFLDSNWLEETASPTHKSYVKGVLAHDKSVFFRIGNIETGSKSQFFFGISHQSQWGGTVYQAYITAEGQKTYHITEQRAGISDFLRVMFARNGREGSTPADSVHVSGSQYGSYLLKYDYKLKNNDCISLYTQHYFEDVSGMVFDNYRDMMLGIQYKSSRKRIISNAVFEYIYTKFQSGPIHFNLYMDDDHSHLQGKGKGNDDYYNNTDYIQGPSHFGRTTGTPLLLSPEYNKDGYLNFKSSRIIAFHTGISGYLHSDVSYRLLATTGQSWGRYYVPFANIKDGIATNLDLIYTPSKLKDLEIKLTIAYNKGDFFAEKAFGGGLTIVKRGLIGKSNK